MAYMKIITSAETWTCPKTGTYKIICVGEGGDGTSSSSDASSGKCGKIAMATADYTAGATVECAFTYSGTVRFGAALSAEKGGVNALAKYTVADSDTVYSGGEGGYTFDGVYGGIGERLIKSTDAATYTNATKNGGAAGEAGFGYGAGGGAYYGDANNHGHTDGSGGAIIIAEM